MKLYRVNYSGSVLFAAEGDRDAVNQAEYWIKEEVRFGGGVEEWEYPEEVVEELSLPNGWDRDTLVWGDFDRLGVYSVKDVWEGRAKRRG